MRVDSNIHIRHIMLYHYQKGWKAAQSFRDLNELFGEGTISESQCREWFARFKFGDTSLEDKSGRGRPSDFEDQGLLAAVEEDESSIGSVHNYPAFIFAHFFIIKIGVLFTFFIKIFPSI